MDRRRFVIGAAATALAPGPAFAQEAFPSHAITIINAFPPGGINDIVTRPLAAAMEPILKQPVVVETKAGAAGQVGAQVAASAKPDGYTLLSHNTGISGYAEVDKLFGRPVKVTRADFIPLARLIADPVLLLVNEQQPYQDAEASLSTAARAHPGHSRFQLRWALRREPSAARVSGNDDRPAAAASSSDRRGRPRHHGHSRQQRPGHNPIRIGHAAAHQSRQAAPARHFQRQALEIVAGRADPQGAGLRRGILSVGRNIRTQRHAAGHRCHVACGHQQGGAIGPVQTTLANVGQELDYLDGPDFQKFWDVDGRRTDEAVIAIGRQG